MAIVNPITGKTDEQVLAESTAVAQKAAQMIGGTFTQGSVSPTGELLGGFTPTAPSTITSDSVTPTPTPAYVSPTTSPIPALPELSTIETQAQSETEKLRQLISSSTGEAGFKAEQEQAVGLPGLEKVQRDLQAQLAQLSADSLAGTEQIRQRPTSVVAIQRETERFNREIAVKSLGLNALLEASRGNLATARDAVDRATGAKFDPLKAEIDARMKNLDLLIASPAYTAAEKKRAEAQRVRQQEELDKVGQDRADYQAVRQIAIDTIDAAAKQGITLDAVTINAIANAKDPIEAARLAAQTGVFKGYQVAGSQVASIQEYEYAKKGGYTGTYNDYQNLDANRKASIAAAGVAGANGLNSKQTQNFLTITNKFQADPFINAALKGQTAIAVANQVIANPSNAANQLKSLYVLVKNLDPDSAVREGEIALAEKTQSYLQTWQTSLTRIASGQVISPSAATNLALATVELASAWNQTAQSREAQYKAQAAGAGIADAFNEYLSSSNLGYKNSQMTADSSGNLSDQDAYKLYLQTVSGDQTPLSSQAPAYAPASSSVTPTTTSGGVGTGKVFSFLNSLIGR